MMEKKKRKQEQRLTCAFVDEFALLPIEDLGHTPIQRDNKGEKGVYKNPQFFKDPFLWNLKT